MLTKEAMIIYYTNLRTNKRMNLMKNFSPVVLGALGHH